MKPVSNYSAPPMRSSSVNISLTDRRLAKRCFLCDQTRETVHRPKRSSLDEFSGTRKHIRKFLQIASGISIGVSISLLLSGGLGSPIGFILGIAAGSAYAIIGPEKALEIILRAASAVYQQVAYVVNRWRHPAIQRPV